MFIPFEQLPDHARLWVYQSNRRLSDNEVQLIRQEGARFTDQWAAHGRALRASVTVLHHHFLIIAVDEQYHQASGCSIDSSVGFVRSIESVLMGQGAAVDFFDRTLIAFWIDNSVKLSPLSEAKQQISAGVIQPDTCLFNHLIATKAELETQWKTRLSDSWLARHLPKVRASV